MSNYIHRAVIVILIMTATNISPALAQNRGGSADIQAARDELNSMLDLGRFLGFIHTMSAEQAPLRLSDPQVEQLLTIVREISQTRRLTGSIADSYLSHIEDEVLTTRQLTFTDQLWIASDRERMSSAGAPSATAQQRGSGRASGEGSGSSSSTSADQSEPVSDLAVFAGGGDFNPLVDPGRPQSESFLAFIAYLENRTGGNPP